MSIKFKCSKSRAGFAFLILLFLIAGCTKENAGNTKKDGVTVYEEQLKTIKEQVFSKTFNMTTEERRMYLMSWELQGAAKSGANKLVVEFNNYVLDKKLASKGVDVFFVPDTKEEIDKETDEFSYVRNLLKQNEKEKFKDSTENWPSSKKSRFLNYIELKKNPEYQVVLDDINIGTRIVRVKGTEALGYAGADKDKFDSKMSELSNELVNFVTDMNLKHNSKNFNKIESELSSEIEVIMILFALSYQ